MKRWPTARSIVWGIAVFLCSCSGSISGSNEEPSDTDSGNSRGGSGGSRRNGGSAGGGAAGGSTGVDPFDRNPVLPLACADPKGVHPGASPIVRLTTTEYNNTLRDLIPGGGSLAPQVLPLENETEGFTNNVQAQTSSPALVEAYEEGARAAAAKAVAALGQLVPCKPSGAAEEATCAQTLIESFGARAFRRPLEADEVTRLKGLFVALRDQHGYQAAVETTVSTMLQMPQFLFRTELAGRKVGEAVALTGHELASRLSYLFWDTMPDAELFAAAKAGKLDSVDGVAAEAARLFADARARPVIADFHRQWLDMKRIEDRADKKSPEVFPGLAPTLGASMNAATRRFVERVFWDSGARLGTLLTDDKADADATLAPLYGATVSGAGMQTVALDGRRQLGLLGQAGVMAGLAHEGLHSPVLRGIFVLDRLLCAKPQPPPQDANTSLPSVPPGSDIKTTRQRFEQLHEVGSCKGCHKIIDGVGFAFESFDAVGRYRENENGAPVNTETTVVSTSDVDGTYAGAVPLVQALARSEQVHQCVVTEWFRYTLSRNPDEQDGCTIRPLTDALLASKGDMKDLVLRLVQSNAFRFRSPLP